MASNTRATTRSLQTSRNFLVHSTDKNWFILFILSFILFILSFDQFARLRYCSENCISVQLTIVHFSSRCLTLLPRLFIYCVHINKILLFLGHRAFGGAMLSVTLDRSWPVFSIPTTSLRGSWCQCFVTLVVSTSPQKP